MTPEPIVSGLTTGVRALDLVTGGLQPGAVYLVSGASGSGRTALLMAILGSPERGDVLLVSFSDSVDVIEQRLAQLPDESRSPWIVSMKNDRSRTAAARLAEMRSKGREPVVLLADDVDRSHRGAVAALAGLSAVAHALGIPTVATCDRETAASLGPDWADSVIDLKPSSPASSAGQAVDVVVRAGDSVSEPIRLAVANGQIVDA